MRLLRLLPLLLFCTFPVAQTSPSATLEQQLKNQFVGNIVKLDHWYQSESQSYDAAGKYLGNAKEGYFVSFGVLAIDRVKVKDDRIVFDAHRILIYWPAQEKPGTFDKKAPPTNLANHDPHPVLMDLKKAIVHLQIRLATATPTMIDADRALAVVFGNKQSLTPRLPYFFRANYDELFSGQWDIVHPAAPLAGVYSATQFIPPAESSSAASATAQTSGAAQPSSFAQMTSETQIHPGGARTAGKSVKPPVATYAPDPPYDSAARADRVEGIVEIEVIVNADGKPSYVDVVGGLTPGLEKNAAETVKSWRFQPATLDGKPVPVYVNVQVHYHLY